VNVSTVLPWELNPVLLQDRLETVARIAVATRNRAFAEGDRAAGDTNWGLACKAHERLMHALSEVVSQGAHPWLVLVRDGLYLMPIVDGVPVRLYRGAADKPSSRHLDAARFEHQRAQPAAPQLAFQFMGAAPADESEGPWYWMMAMETDATGQVTRVVFVQANDAGETRHPWECAAAVTNVEAVAPACEPAPIVRLSTREPGAEQPTAGALRARRPRVAAAAIRQEGLWDALGAE
jgi:hypothetical protein